MLGLNGAARRPPGYKKEPPPREKDTTPESEPVQPSSPVARKSEAYTLDYSIPWGMIPEVQTPGSDRQHFPSPPINIPQPPAPEPVSPEMIALMLLDNMAKLPPTGPPPNEPLPPMDVQNLIVRIYIRIAHAYSIFNCYSITRPFSPF